MVSAHLKTSKAIVIIGATASGKTKLAHQLADVLQERGQKTCLINLDAFQIYRGFDIGTAKPTSAEQKKYDYHLVDLCNPEEGVDAREFADKALSLCHEAILQNIFPICVGGSGLYLRAFLHGLDDFPERNDDIRNFLRAYAKRWGWPKLHEWLSQLDSKRAAELHPNDKTRIERALEIILLSGKSVTAQRTQTEDLKNQRKRLRSFVIHVDGADEFLKERVTERTVSLWQVGWVDEARRLLARYGANVLEFSAARAIGYQQIFQFLLNENGFQEKDVLQDLISKTWQYVRRQRTWNAKEVCDYLWNWEEPCLDDLLGSLKKFEDGQFFS